MAILPPSFLFRLVLLLVLCLGHSEAQDASPHDGCIHLPIIHSTNSQYFGKRAISLSLTNRTDIAYYAQLNIGTPPQPVYVQLDTGSFELWVNPFCSGLTGADASFCATVGHYDTARSSTATSLGVGTTLRYGIGSANITYFKDNISLSGLATSLKSVQFGVASFSEDQFSGVMGIGYGLGIATRYRNFVDELSAQNATKVKAFTVALGSLQEQEGIVVFGGVDTSRFSGNLAPQPIIPASESPDNVPRYWINMESLSLHPPSGRVSTYASSNIPVFLDTGSTMTLLPTALAAEIARDFGSNGEDANGFYEIGCDLADIDGTLDFAFNGTTIRVPYNELIRKVEGNPPTCFLGISPSDDFTLLGDTFMRSAYAVFDLEQNIIWMSQSENCGSSPAALTNISTLDSLTGACGVNKVASPATMVSTSMTVATPSPVSSMTTVNPNSSNTAAAIPSASAKTGDSPSSAARVAKASTLGICVAFVAVAVIF